MEQMRTQDMRQDMHSFMLLRHGYVIAEGWWAPYTKEMHHAMFSLSKSFISTAVGFMVAEGLLTVEDKVVSYFTKECPEPAGYLDEMRIKDLLIMSTGQGQDITVNIIYQSDGDWVKAFFTSLVTTEPGNKFLYNSGATYILSVIVQKVTGQKVMDYLEPRLFAPLGIKGARSNECPKGYNTGGFGMWLRTEDIARFGQLYLNQGIWEGKQILPPQWIEEATCSQIDNAGDSQAAMDWQLGYGYQFWRGQYNSYRADGAYGQFCIVMPEQDMVLAITSGLSMTAELMEAIWKNLIPELSDKALPEDVYSNKVKEKLSNLQVLLPVGFRRSKHKIVLEGKKLVIDKITPDFDSPERNREELNYVTFHFQEDKIQIIVDISGQEAIWKVGVGHWMKNEVMKKGQPSLAYMTGIWPDKDTLFIQCRFVETPYAVHYKFTFYEGKANLESKVNLYFDATQWDHEICWQNNRS